MADLLVHSMAEFTDLIVKALQIVGAKSVVEVGAEYGTMTDRLIRQTRSAAGTLVSIDPAPSPELLRLYEDHPHARLVADYSLNALPTLEADAFLIDGDHNYYTVRQESIAIRETCLKAGKPLLIFYHDVCWPWARRDLYYDPDRVPQAYRRPHAWDRGVTLDEPGLIEGGFRGEGRWAAACEEGGPRNGVLTAVEDFARGVDENLSWALIPAVFGLGVLFDERAAWARELAAFLAPYHMNPLLQTLERNRLECYLAVIAWQDRWNHERLG